MDATHVYRGIRLANGRTIVAVDGAPLSYDGLGLWLKVASPFDWGYAGTGAAHLARAILQHHVGATVAPSVFERFKATTVVAWPSAQWQLTSDDVDRVLAEIRSAARLTCVRCADTGRCPDRRGAWQRCPCRPKPTKTKATTCDDPITTR